MTERTPDDSPKNLLSEENGRHRPRRGQRLVSGFERCKELNRSLVREVIKLWQQGGAIRAVTPPPPKETP